MKTILISVAAAAIVAAVVSLGITRWTAQPQPADVHAVEWLRGELRLSDDQAAQLTKLTEQYRVVVNQNCVQHCDARFGLSEQLARPQVDLPAAEAAVDKMCHAANAVEHATLQHILRVRELLTPAQRDQYAKLLGQQLCQMPQ